MGKIPEVPFTRERFYTEHADQHGEESRKRHLLRYEWAASGFPDGSTVLDAGSGSGYGDHILIRRASRVVGVEISKDAVAYARAKAELMQEPAIEYVVADLRTMDLWNLKFDVAVCIEVIEHVGPADQRLIIEHLKFHLKDDGWLFITTPVRVEGQPMTEFHDHEFSAPEFKKFLGEHFSTVHFDDPSHFGISQDFLLAVCRGPLR